LPDECSSLIRLAIAAGLSGDCAATTPAASSHAESATNATNAALRQNSKDMTTPSIAARNESAWCVGQK
jgi:hypothetical protein